MKYITNIKRNISSLPGWHTKRKIVVFESDDWGGIRMPSKKVYDYCLKKGYQVDKNLFSKYDSLASEEDLTLLFDTLIGFKDSQGKSPIFTANCIVANPNFEKIRNSGFQQYHYEPITQTFKKYPRHAKNWEIWEEAICSGLFYPQSHGREHLNVSRFMKDLISGKPDAKFAFNLEMSGLFEKDKVESGNQYVVALEHFNDSDKNDKIKITTDGLSLFKELFKRPSESFIACNYTWHPDLESTLHRAGVRFIQGSRNQLIPKGNYRGFKRKSHYIGQKNKLGQIYLVRNAYFEPTLNDRKDWENSCLHDIATAFRWNKPAIISTHRINFVGYIDIKNRDRNLIMLRNLLNSILTKWPEVEFMSSVELGEIITKTKIYK